MNFVIVSETFWSELNDPFSSTRAEEPVKYNEFSYT